MQQKAVIINETGAYAHMNGQTVEVNMDWFYTDLSVDRIVLSWKENGVKVSVDFKFKNVLFVDASQLAQKVYDSKIGEQRTNGIKSKNAWHGLLRWAEVHGVKLAPEHTYSA